MLDTLNITKVTERNGVNGDPRNRYIWSMTLDDKDKLYVGTLTQDYNGDNLTSLIWSILTASNNQQVSAIVDTLLRQWSGLPIFESTGAQIYSKVNNETSFKLELQAAPEFLGFRKMITYNGNIYAGSANGPEGPYDFAPYDFSMYESNVGAKVSSHFDRCGLHF